MPSTCKCLKAEAASCLRSFSPLLQVCLLLQPCYLRGPLCSCAQQANTGATVLLARPCPHVLTVLHHSGLGGEVRRSGITFDILHPLTHYAVPEPQSSLSETVSMPPYSLRAPAPTLMTHSLLAGLFLKGIIRPIYLLMDISRSKCDHVAP